MLAARARALVDGRLSPSLDDVAILAEPALKHRMALSFAARAEGETISAVIGRLVGQDDPMIRRLLAQMTLPPSIRHDAATLSARLPSLVIAARRVAQTVRHGVHGRRRAGSGETFWQFRPFLSGEPSSRVDWRRSAREERAFVREREWEAAHTVWIWFDRSASMQFASSLAQASKVDRAALLALAFADLCVRGGERAGLLGLTRPLATQGVVERFAEAIATDERLRSLRKPRCRPRIARRSALDGSHDRRFSVRRPKTSLGRSGP